MSEQPPHDPYSGQGQPPQPPHQQWGPPAYGQPGFPPPGAPGHTRTNGKAIASLITGIGSVVLSMCCLGIAGAVAIFLGVRARGEIARSGGTQDGAGLAVGGIITGIVGLLISIGLIVLLVILIATGNAEYYIDSDTGMY